MIIVDIIIDTRPTVSNSPILAVPWCEEKARLPILHIVVSELTITPRKELVKKMFLPV